MNAIQFTWFTTVKVGMFHKAENQKGSFLEQTKAAREERALEKRKDVAAVVIQKLVRGWLARVKFSKKILWVRLRHTFLVHLFSVVHIEIGVLWY